jgi:2-polyprenyl-3-methyl-5-hydroxy-6-metoxy-1,4-benzoquinol methylase
METLEACPICGKEESKTFLKLKDWFLSQEEYKIVECSTCGFKFTNPRPDVAEIGKYYKSEEYISHSNTKKGLISQVYQMVRNHTIAKKYADISKIKPQGKILDIGCATGDFLAYFKNKGWDTTGIEPDVDAKAMAIENHQIDVRDEAALDSFEPEQFDVITMWHVLEHVYTLQERVAQLKRLLKKDGLLVIAVPNPASYDAKYYGKYWAAYDVPRHIYHFTRKDISLLFSQQNFKISKVKPMVFDSFYVSMLSEKYVKEGGNLISAFKQGLKSNIKATKTGEYSSLIYYLQSSSEQK